MLFGWLERRRRRQLLAAPFPADWVDHLRLNVAVYQFLTAAEQARLRDDLRVFVAEKWWEGCGGLTLSDEVRVAIAAQACLLLLGVEHDYYKHVRTILVYPSAYRSPDGQVGPDGVVREGIGRLGEAWHRGPVVLAWDEVRAGGQNHRDGRNVVMHEFAHQLDFLDGLNDGTPPLRDAEQYREWQRVMTGEFDRLRADVERGRATLLDSYGATDPAEFFAVATECFFEKPRQMQERHSDVYAVLRGYYCQDPACWFARSDGAPHEVAAAVASVRRRRGSRRRQHARKG
jgi:Mlc titration factor MtfA (ptsG expression regulator)